MNKISLSAMRALRSKKKIYRKISKRMADFTTLADDMDFIISDLLCIALKDPSIQIKQQA